MKKLCFIIRLWRTIGPDEVFEIATEAVEAIEAVVAVEAAKGSRDNEE